MQKYDTFVISSNEKKLAQIEFKFQLIRPNVCVVAQIRKKKTKNKNIRKLLFSLPIKLNY